MLKWHVIHVKGSPACGVSHNPPVHLNPSHRMRHRVEYQGTPSPRTTRRAMGALSPMPRHMPEGWKHQEKIQAQNELE